MTAESCIFCRIANNQDTQSRHLFYQSDNWCGLLVLHPVTRGHVIVFPRDHYESLESMRELVGLLTVESVRVASTITQVLNAPAYSLKVNNHVFAIEPDNPQHVRHIHMHIIPRYGKEDSLYFPDASTEKDYFSKYSKILATIEW